MDDLFRVGVIKETHGIRGEVKVFPTTDDMHRFSDLKEVLLIHQKKQMKMELESVRFFKNFEHFFVIANTATKTESHIKSDLPSQQQFFTIYSCGR